MSTCAFTPCVHVCLIGMNKINRTKVRSTDQVRKSKTSSAQTRIGTGFHYTRIVALN